MQFASSGEVKIAYSVEGSGEKTVLLVMGLGARAADWGTRFPNELAKHYRVVRMDNRGIGASDKPSTTWSLEDMAADAVAVLDAVGVERAHLAGLSMGGMISQLVALLHPERVDRLALISTHFGGPSIVPPEPSVRAIYAPAAGTPFDDVMRTAIRVIAAPSFAESHPDLVEELVKIACEQPTSKRTFMAQLQAIISSDRSERVGEIRAPTLVVHGDLDPLIPCENGRRLAAAIPNSKLVILDGCGHVASWEDPERLARAVLEHFGA